MQTQVVELENENLPSQFEAQRDLVKDWLDSKGESTRKAYQFDLSDFCKWLKVPEGKAVAGLLRAGPGNANRVVMKYKNYLKNERELSGHTINRRLSTLRSLIDFARKMGEVNWTLSVENEQAETYRDTSGPGRAGYEKMLKLAREREDAKGARDHAIMRLLHDRGLRRNEVLSLDIEHVEHRRLNVLRKGKNQRKWLSIPEQTAEAIQDWLDWRGTEPGALFVNFDRSSSEQGRLTGSGLYDILAHYGKKAGVKNFNPHGFRHLAGTEASLRTNGNAFAVKEFLGHADISTSQIYVENSEDLGGQVADMVAANVG